jgi:hypothetical protein
LADLEREGDKLIKVHVSESAYPEHLKIICYDRTNKIVKIPALEQKVQRGATIIRDPKA